MNGVANFTNGSSSSCEALRSISLVHGTRGLQSLLTLQLLLMLLVCSGYAVPGRSLVWLLLRLGTPDNFFILMSPTSIRRRLATLQRACMAYSPWQQQLQQATDRELAVLLAVGADAPQWMLFLAETGRAVGVNVPLVEVVCWRKQEFARQFDMDDFLAWQGTRQQESSSC
jgi:hypothetical protein